MISSDVDAAIIGAGPAGSTVARLLAQRGCRVALIERTRFNTPRVGESLSPVVRPLLAELGLWHKFMSLDPLASHGTRSVWGEAVSREHSHVVSPYGCGWHIDRLAFDRMLAEAAMAAGAELRCGAALVHCEAAPDSRWLLRFDEHNTDDAGAASTRVEPLQSAPGSHRTSTSIGTSPPGDPRNRMIGLPGGGESRGGPNGQWSGRRSINMRARVLIDATGRSAHVARLVGARRIMFDRLVAVAVMFGAIEMSREGFVLVETAPEGWWYSAPVPRDRMMAMLMTDGDLCASNKLSVMARWRESLTGAPATSARLAGATLWGPRVFSAVSQRLRRNALDSPWLAVGDASLAVDPVSGSGVIRALRSAQAGAGTALAVLSGQTREAIEAYEAECDRDCTTYLHERALYYGMEQRWQTSAFWQRRAGVQAGIEANGPPSVLQNQRPDQRA